MVSSKGFLWAEPVCNSVCQNLIPTAMYWKKGRAKLEFAIAKGKKNYRVPKSYGLDSIMSDILKKCWQDLFHSAIALPSERLREK